jgi:hypothetical protein
MPAENPWGKRLRGAIGAWAIVSAMISPLLTAYHFLSSRAHLLPTAPEDAGPVAIVVNTCLLTAGVMWFGLLTGGAFVTLSLRGDRLRGTIGKAALLLFFALIFLYGSDRYEHDMGLYFLAIVVCSLSPMARLFETYFAQSVVLCGTISMLSLLLVPGWFHDWWPSWTGRQDFTLIPLSSMKLGEWWVAFIGACVYVGAYIAFKQWHTKGEWLKDARSRIRPN